MGIPASLLADMNFVPRDRPVVLLMRHSIRFPITDIAETYIVGLTEEGVRVAENLGGILHHAFQPGRLLSSPVGRCVATAEAIALGAGWPAEVRQDERLSHPFMEPAWDLVRHARANGQMPFQIRALLHLMLEKSIDLPRLDVMVTHDTVVGTMAGYLLHAPVLDEHWPAFLEGVFVWRDTDKIHARWRGEETIFTPQFARVA